MSRTYCRNGYFRLQFRTPKWNKRARGKLFARIDGRNEVKCRDLTVSSPPESQVHPLNPQTGLKEKTGFDSND